MVRKLIASELPVAHEITGQLGSVGMRIRSISPRSCTIEHQRQIRVASEGNLLFRWGGQYRMTVKILRSRLGPLSVGGMGYHTTVEFVEPSEEAARAIEELLEQTLALAGAANTPSAEGISSSILPL